MEEIFFHAYVFHRTAPLFRFGADLNAVVAVIYFVIVDLRIYGAVGVYPGAGGVITVTVIYCIAVSLAVSWLIKLLLRTVAHVSVKINAYIRVVMDTVPVHPYIFAVSRNRQGFAPVGHVF